jgi:hypothetical protein
MASHVSDPQCVCGGVRTVVIKNIKIVQHEWDQNLFYSVKFQLHEYDSAGGPGGGEVPREWCGRPRQHRAAGAKRAIKFII